MSLNNMIRLPKTLANRLTLWYASAFSILLLATLLGMIFAISSIFDVETREDLEEDIEELQELYESQGMERMLWEINQEIKYEDPEHFFIRFYDAQGESIISSDLKHWQQLGEYKTIYEQLERADDEVLLESIPHEDDELEATTATGVIGDDLIVQLGESSEEKQDVMEILFLVSGIIFCLVIPFGAWVGWLTARKAVSGIKEISDAVGDIQNGQFDRRVSVQSKGDEIDELAITFNTMADRIGKLIEEMREMTDNIAHDLRSPLARIRAISESTLSSNSVECHRAASDTLEECDRLLQMINMTLDVAEAEAGVRDSKKESINLSSLAEDACELFEPLAENKNIKFSTHLIDDCVVTGNKHNIQRMITNLIDNALKYTPEKGEVIVELDSSQGDAIIKVADTGVGIPNDDKDRIFNRFYRCDHSRTKDGCGLGLSFSRAVARAHGGDIKLKAEQTHSSVFEISLPINDQ